MAALLGGSTAFATDVLTFHNDPARTGLNDRETILTPRNVNQASFGLLNLPVDGKVDAQPLYVSSEPIDGIGRKNVLVVATEHDSVYAFDADSGTLYWKVSLLRTGEVPSDSRGCGQVTPEIGITATPVIVRAANNPGEIYLVAMSKGSSPTTYHQRFHALSLSDGSEKAGSPVEIEASFPGKGPGNNGSGHVIFNPANYKERAALLLHNNIIYTAWASHCDISPYTGWIIGYHTHSLAQVRVLNVNPNGYPTSTFLPDGSGNSFWGSGAGLAADNNGYLYGLCANGPFDTRLINGFPKAGDYGDSFLKLSAQDLTVTDYFTPYNQAQEAASDTDLGAGGVLILPDMTNSSGTLVRLAAGAGKDGHIYIVNREQLGKINLKTSDNSNVYQDISDALGGSVYGSPAYFDGFLFFGPVGTTLKQFTFKQGLLSASASSSTTTTFGYPGTTPSLSSNHRQSGILWAYENAASGTAILHAYNALDLAQELYNSGQAPSGRDTFGTGNKFIVPTVCNGKVFVATTNSVGVFGLLSIVAAQNVTQWVKVDRVEDPEERSNGTVTERVSLTNTGSNAIAGPISLAFDELSADSYVADPEGSTTAVAPTGSFFVDFTPAAGELVKGQTETRLVVFRSSSEAVRYEPRVLAGPGVR
ncbi:MAG: pyrrolo-quinoline quinone [Verrucomicrobia bacterium]|nr:pyrrolo-quinoline quinone [Verrucomicrobiota bacterium]